MTTQHNAVREMASLAETLRKQVADSRHAQAQRGRRRGGGPPNAGDQQIQDNLLSLLELIDSLDCPSGDAPLSAPSQSMANPSTSNPSTASQSALSPASDRVLHTLDQALAGWQAKICLAYSQAATHELAGQLQQAQQLLSGLRDREQQLENQRQQVEARFAQALHREAATNRQRREMAQRLRRQKAEMLLELEQQAAELAEQHAQRQVDHQSQQEVEALRSEAESLRNQTQALRHEADSLRRETETLRSQADNLRSETDKLRSETDKLQSETQSLRSETETLRNETETLRGEGDLLREELQQACQQLDQREQAAASADNVHQTRLAELEQHLAQAREEVIELQEQLQAQPETPLLIEAQANTITGLEAELSRLKHQLADLQQQNSDLAAAVAKHQVITSGNTPHVSFQHESLSWEERKRLIMAQLESESIEDDEPADEQQLQRHLEIEQVLNTTQQEIEKRDREIAELQAIVEQQADTRQGVAIGAAAFAQAFDNDEMIQQERQKLKEIQREWEEKLRQAEIDVSLERARLARERTQLEQELENIRLERLQADKEPEKAKKRKWLEHLGLREEHRSEG